MRTYYSRLPTLPGLDPRKLGQYQNLEFEHSKITSYIVLIGKIWIISQPGYLLPISLNAKVHCRKILKVKRVSLVPSSHVCIRDHS